MPVGDARLAEPPAEIHDAAGAPVWKVHQARAEVLGGAAEALDLLQPRLDVARGALEALGARLPRRLVHHAAPGHRDALLLGGQRLARLEAGGVRGHHTLHDARELRDQALDVLGHEVALGPGARESPARRTPRALPGARARRASASARCRRCGWGR